MIKYVVYNPRVDTGLQYYKLATGRKRVDSGATNVLRNEATLFDTEEEAMRVIGREGLRFEPVEVPEQVVNTENNMSYAGYVVQIGNTDRFVKLVNGERMSVPESRATVFALKEAALRACTEDDDKVMAVRNHNFTSSTNRWVVYNPQRNAFFGPAACHYYTDQIDEATWFTSEADAKAKCLVGEVVRRVSISLV